MWQLSGYRQVMWPLNNMYLHVTCIETNDSKVTYKIRKSYIDFVSYVLMTLTS